MPYSWQVHRNRKSIMETIELELDENGSPVTLEAAAWFVSFVPRIKKRWCHPFVSATNTSSP